MVNDSCPDNPAPTKAPDADLISKLEIKYIWSTYTNQNSLLNTSYIGKTQKVIVKYYLHRPPPPPPKSVFQ